MPRVLPAATVAPFADRPDLLLDARGGLVVASTLTLYVSDLHLGAAEAHQRRGNLLARSDADVRTISAVVAMAAEHGCREVVLLGDVKHEFGFPRQAESAAITTLLELLESISVQTHFVLGNHDNGLASWLGDLAWPCARHHVCTQARIYAVHGSEPGVLRPTECAGYLVLLGHVHPAVTLADGRGAKLKMPAFLVGTDHIILPAVSPLAGGANVIHPTQDVMPYLYDDYRIFAIDRPRQGVPVLRTLKRLSALRGW